VTPRVLVVDDSDFTRTLIVRTLERAGFEVLTARDGAEGAVMALHERPAAVVTDLEMPVMDGYQLLRLLKSDPSSSHLPVVILTSHGEAPSRFWGLHTGADAYLTKDYEASELVDTVRRLVAETTLAAQPAVEPPQGPLEVLARVARQLDSNLLSATLVNTLLEHGMGVDDLHEACERCLATIAEVVDAPLLVVGLSEPEAVYLHLRLSQALPLKGVERAANAVLSAIPVNPGAVVDAQVTGPREAEGDVELPDLEFLPLPLTSTSGMLAVLPRNPQQFETVSRHLVQGLLPHLAVVLDNARLSQRLRELSSHDGLTRLLNHRAVHERLGEELARSIRFDRPLSVILCDLDLFKRVNDTYGHLAGDAVLRAVAASFRTTLRTSDVIGRYGGEEFLVVLTESELEAARQVAERLRAGLAHREVPLPAGGSLAVTASFGVAARNEVPAPGSAEALVSLADTRLYQAKAAGRNCVRP